MHVSSHTAYKAELKAFFFNSELIQSNILENWCTNDDSYCLIWWADWNTKLTVSLKLKDFVGRGKQLKLANRLPFGIGAQGPD